MVHKRHKTRFKSGMKTTRKKRAGFAKRQRARIFDYSRVRKKRRRMDE